MKASVSWAALLAFGASARAQTTYYVDGSCGDDAWSGLSPVCAAPDGPKKSIGWGVAQAYPGDTVEVAPGVYSLKTNHFSIRDPITVRSREGPFATILDGEGGIEVINVHDFGGGPGLIEGFTFTNIKTQYPAPVVLSEADAMLVDCRFTNNTGWYAGALWDEAGAADTATLVNCVFEGNWGGSVGAVGSGAAEVLGCTFFGNAADGPSSVGAAGDLLIVNSVFRGDPPHIGGDGSVTYCNVQGGYPGEGNIDADPLFADPATGDLRLLPGSPCIDAGDNTAVPDWLRTDIGGLERFVDDPATADTGKGTAPIVDMGAHEFQVACYPDFTADGFLDLFDFLAYVNAFNAGDAEADCDKSVNLDLFDFLCFVNAFNAGC